MDKAALVNVDIGRGVDVIDILDRANVKISVALWAHLSEYEDWRLVISSREFKDGELKAAYRRIHDSLRAKGMTPGKTPELLILPMNDPFIKVLRRIFGKSKSVEGMHLGGQMIGDRFVEDAFVYRIT
jgi:hypothetical protein